MKQSFGEWLENNNRLDILNRWDYELNKLSPYDISITDKNKYYFKCNRNIHESSLFHINNFHNGKAKNLECSKCKSFAQNIIDSYDEDYLYKIWNKSNSKSPWDYGYQSKQKVKFNCLNNPNHIYEQSCDAKSQGQKCPYCSGRKLSFDNSAGYKNKYICSIWSDKNEKTPYEYTLHSSSKVWWKCNNNIHNDYQRSLSSSYECNYLCPECAKNNREYEDLTNKTFGEWTVLSEDKTKYKKGKDYYWICKCSCGTIRSISGTTLKNGTSKTCGGGIHKKGEKSPTWKGGITSENILGRNCKEYDVWRDNVYKKDHYTCQCCLKSKNIIKNAHHIENYSTNKEKRYDVDNGITLCQECHYSSFIDSFHNIYGTKNNNGKQLEEYINYKRQKIGIKELFNLNEYLNQK